MESNSNSNNNEYIETSYDLALRCQKFLELHSDNSVTRLYNPFTDRVIKKYGPTYNNIYNQVKRYLQSLDDEEFHSPIKELEIVRYEVPPEMDPNASPERYLVNQPTKDTILDNWHTKIESKLEILRNKKDIISQIQIRYLNFKYDEAIMTRFNNQEDFEMKKNQWIERNIELYSFLDHYKPEIFQNEYICKQLIVHNYSSLKDFIEWLPAVCDTFLMKRYDNPYGSSNLSHAQRYPISLIQLWIYQPFIFEARKFLKKQKAKLVQYLATKPAHLIKIKKQHYTSLILSYFLSKTKIEALESVKKDYTIYFQNLLTAFFEFSDRDKIYTRPSYAMILTDFLSNRIRPYRYTQINYEDLEEFDKIIQYLNSPPSQNNNTENENENQVV
jgi:hypothetical protein